MEDRPGLPGVAEERRKAALDRLAERYRRSKHIAWGVALVALWCLIGALMALAWCWMRR